MILAIHYRKADEPNNTAPGCWKEFTSREAAECWLKHRAGKTKTSPKGTAIFQAREAINTVLQFGKEQQPVSLIKALENYLKWKRL